MAPNVRKELLRRTINKPIQTPLGNGPVELSVEIIKAMRFLIKC